MNKYLTILIFFAFIAVSCSTDSNEVAQVNPAPIDQPVISPELFTDVGLLWNFAPESSGIVLSDGFIYTHNDSGNSSKFYKVNPIDASLVQTISVTNFENIDWEDITADDDFIYIGDFGNNEGIRTDLRILKVSKAQFINQTDANVNVTAELIGFTYSEQTTFISSKTHNFDCETLISKGDYLYLFTKDRGDNKTRVYKISKTPGQYSLTAITSYNVNGLITGGDYNAETNEIVLIGYSASGHRNSFIYSLSNFTDDSFFSGTVVEKIIGNTKNDWQTEGISFGSSDGKKLFISCETSIYTKAKLYKSDKSTLGL